MAFWSKWFQRKPAPPKETSFPHTLEVIPGQLSVCVYSHEVQLRERRAPAWSFVTQSLQGPPRGELLLTLLRRPEEPASPVPAAPVEVLRQLQQRSVQGQAPKIGAHIQLAPGTLGRSDFAGVIFLPAPQLAAVSYPFLTTSVFALTQDELESVRRFGPYRVLTTLGVQHHCYPSPYWNDRGRANASSRDALDASLWTKVPRYSLPGARLRLKGDRFALRVFRGALPRLQQLVEGLTQERAFAFLTEPDPDANARLIWRPGQSSPRWISPDGIEANQITGGGMIIAVSDAHQDRSQIVEDGFSLVLRTVSWVKLKLALTRGAPLELFTSEGPSFAIEWMDDPS